MKQRNAGHPGVLRGVRAGLVWAVKSSPPWRSKRDQSTHEHTAESKPHDGQLSAEIKKLRHFTKQLDSGTDSRVHTVLVNGNPLRSGELARLTGVSTDTLRHYEKLGILPISQRTNGGYRMFPPSSIERVQLAQRALQLGFSLNELSEILRTRDNGGVPCNRVLNLTEEKLRSLDRQIEELRRTQAYMRKLVRQWRRKLENTPPGSKAMLLHSLVDNQRRTPNKLRRISRP